MNYRTALISALAYFFIFTINGICSEGLIVNENGNVGIGTAAPAGKMEINQTANASALFLRSNQASYLSSYQAVLNIETTNGTANPTVSYAIKSAYNNMPIFAARNDGRVGIGTVAPAGKMEINQTANASALFLRSNQAGYLSSYQAVLNIKTTNGTANPTASYAIRSEYNDTPIFAARNDGRVGIGMLHPSYSLDVNGTIRGSNVSPSDERWKANISTIPDALDKISRLRGVSYEWTDPSRGTGGQIGVIAQEVEDIFPEAVSTDSQGYKSVAYGKLVSPLIEAVKTLKAENERLKQDNEEIRKQLAEILSMLKDQ